MSNYKLMLTKFSNFLKGSNSEQVHLFILAPPFSGSTLLTELIATSPQASVTNDIDPMEGMKLPGGPALYGNFEQRWNAEYPYDFTALNKLWRKHWILSKKVLVEKSPPLLIRARQIEQYFPSAKFILLVRDPFAQIESLMRRRNWSLETSCEFLNLCFKHQYQNARSLKSALVVRYEDLCDDSEHMCNQILSYIPQLRTLDHRKHFRAHNVQNTALKITNLNASKKGLFSESDIRLIDKNLSESREALRFFNF